MFSYHPVSLARRAANYFARASKPAVTVHDGLDTELLDEALREAWGRLHPANMGGEYLPPLRKGEVEIARISLRIGYGRPDQCPCPAGARAHSLPRRRRVSEISTYVCHPASSVSPLSLGELIALMESASEGGSIIFPILAMNVRDLNAGRAGDVHHRHLGFLRRPRPLLPRADRCLA